MQKSIAINTTHLYTFLIGAALLLMSFAPMTASAASSKPSCLLTITTEAGTKKVTKNGDVSVAAGEEITIKWRGKNADTATLNGDEIDASDSEEFTVDEDTTYTFVFKNGSKKVTCEVEVSVVDGSINSSGLSSAPTKPTFSGTAENLKKVNVSVYKGSKKQFEKKNVSVKRGKWTVKASKPLKSGEYEVRLMDTNGTLLDTEDLTVKATRSNTDDDDDNTDSGSNSSVVTVSTIPLLTGGTIRAGESKPVAYLQLKNTGSEAVTVTGFTLSQKGTANASVVTSLSTVDDKGGFRTESGANPFSGGSALAPSTATIEPGAMKLFTVKATVGSNVVAGTTLKLDVTSVSTNGKESGAFPIAGTTWVVGL